MLKGRGKKLALEEFSSPVLLEGNLEVIKYQTGTRSYSYAKLYKQHGGGLPEELCHLHEPKLIKIEGDRWVMVAGKLVQVAPFP